MSKVEGKSIKVIKFSGKDFKIWFRKFCARANRKNYLALLINIRAMSTISQYISAEGDPSNATNKSIIKLWKLNELAYEDIILSINHTTKQGKADFHLVDDSVTPERPDGNCKIAWQKLTQKYLPKNAQTYIKLKKWVSELESLRNQMNAISIPNKLDMTEVDLIIHILSNLPEEYKVTVAELEKICKANQHHWKWNT